MSYVLLFVALFSAVSVQAAADQERGSLMNVIPINTLTREERCQLVVSIPAEFRAINLENKGAVREFIPRTQSIADATQKITIHHAGIDSGLSKTIFEDLKADASKPGGSLLEEKNEKHKPSYLCTMRIIRRVRAGKPELVAVKHYIGPEHFVGVHYVISLDAMTEQEALTTVKNFMAKRLNIA